MKALRPFDPQEGASLCSRGIWRWSFPPCDVSFLIGVIKLLIGKGSRQWAKIRSLEEDVGFPVMRKWTPAVCCQLRSHTVLHWLHWAQLIRTDFSFNCTLVLVFVLAQTASFFIFKRCSGTLGECITLEAPQASLCPWGSLTGSPVESHLNDSHLAVPCFQMSELK